MTFPPPIPPAWCEIKRVSSGGVKCQRCHESIYFADCVSKKDRSLRKLPFNQSDGQLHLSVCDGTKPKNTISKGEQFLSNRTSLENEILSLTKLLVSKLQTYIQESQTSGQ